VYILIDFSPNKNGGSISCPVVQLAGYMISRIAGQHPGELVGGEFSVNTVIVIGFTFCYGFLYAGGINEESGWRGFAIPHLQEKYSPLVAATIVWLFWALWHLFFDISSHNSLFSILTNRVFFNFLWAVLFVWVFNRAKGSILAPALFHPAMNTFGEFLPRTDAATFLFVALTLYVIISGRMGRKIDTEKSSIK
jgi:membrane protease YdiL (CAAX protease family)